MNSILSGKYILPFSVAAVVLVAGGAFVFSQMSGDPDNNTVSETDYIELRERLEPQKASDYIQVNSPDVLVEYSYKINPTTKFIFRESGQEAWDKGNIILEKNGVEKVIKQNTELSSPSFFAYNAFSTNNPNMYVLSSGIIDVLAYLVTQDYVAVDEEKIVLSIKNAQMETITITKENKVFEIKTLMDDNCGTDLDREGKNAYLVDILVNGERTNSISSPIEVACVSGRNGYFHNPNIVLDGIKVSFDFTQVNFLLRGIQVLPSESQEIWSKEFNLNLQNGTFTVL